ncbi:MULTISPECIES: peptide ABC transporter substrate-binding protein [Streptomycetaceae]|uniref:Peptide transport system secreted peptide-binding protein n=1 Tax=Streptantibioticus cattleyicolor (strain ATCC 35852 / DSM 46488 / JCM 4925 / NBRC 14057 / NRRL 8057) TaxID=1003195 RepID=F8K3K8_STREN|nr:MULTISPECIES: ABC transporter substrate-binding protein [Streptomycetaceae]AEW96326.1 peptide transport system secreted peptide-binding protein [Streptantibioticus cattleyicolor NRRL 8057 = DSM 46488]MYS60841.1 ABC transporter substrate-binding protein [Streptomyces sp. SID5468]CCB76666.1 putative peptide transport system secreted peptide-binding protein [Streptantibioticus cattleyicolor NRRL 8057 = DSM 46488]
MRQPRRRGVGPAVCVLGAVALATGCGGGGDDGGGPGGIVRASWGDPQHPLEPANTNEVQGGKVLDMLFRGLKKYDPKTGAARDWVADSVTSADQQTFTVKLKRGWTFSNGEPVTAHSFTDAWNYAALVTNKQLNAPFFAYIDGYDKVHPASGVPTARTMSGLTVKDDTTFTVRLSQKFSTWPDILGYAAFYPLPTLFFRDHDAWLRKPVGDGPYTVNSYTRGSVMKLRRWDGYPGPDKARNGGVDLRVYTDNNTAYTDLQAGNVDLVDDIPVTQLKNVKRDLGSRYLNQPAGVIQTIAFPMYDPRWGGATMDKVRRGISMAIDRASIAEHIFHGTRTPATDWTSPVLGAKGGYTKGLCGDACTYDPARARQLVREGGGLPGGQVRISYNADTGSHKEWVDAICNSVNNALGNDHACVGSPVGTFADFRNRISGKSMTQPFRAGWQMDYPLIQDFLQPLYYTGGSSNDTHFSNADFDKDVDRANAESDPAAAVARFQDAERILARQMPAIPLWYQNGNAGYTSRLSNVALNQFSVPVYDQLTLG